MKESYLPGPLEGVTCAGLINRGSSTEQGTDLLTLARLSRPSSLYTWYRHISCNVPTFVPGGKCFLETSDKLFFTDFKVQLVYYGITWHFHDFKIRNLKMDVGNPDSLTGS